MLKSLDGESREDEDLNRVDENELKAQNQQETNECLSKQISEVRSTTSESVSVEDEEEEVKDNELEMQNRNEVNSECSIRPNNSVVTETVILIRSEESESVGVEDEGVNDNVVVEMSKISMDERKSKVSESEKQSCVINIRCNSGTTEGESKDGEKVCRICHLSCETSDLIRLGCDCKDDLGISHSHCAEAWFKLKGNRCCEICGVAAKNITGVWDNRFMEEWNDRRYDGNSGVSSGGRWGFWRGQPFCNFLMACLVMAFVLPWFFRVNMF